MPKLFVALAAATAAASPGATAAKTPGVALDSAGLPLTPPLPATLQIHTTRDGLPWPLPDAASSDGTLAHALHCLQITEAADAAAGADAGDAAKPHITVLAGGSSPLSPLQDTMAAMHEEHCRTHRELVEARLEAAPLHMPLDVCQILLPAGSFGRDNLETQLGDSCCAPWSVDVFKRNAGETKDSIVLPGAEGVLDLTAPLNLTVHHRAWMASYNFGSLLVKAAEGTATAAEAEWLAQWHNELNVARSAMAYDCYRTHPEIHAHFRCMYDGVTCADDEGKWDMSKVVEV